MKNQLTTDLGNHQSNVNTALEKLEAENIMARIWEHDQTVWGKGPDEISNRLGWLTSPELMRTAIDELYNFTKEVQDEGFKDVLLLGMGGSSLAPEVFRKTFGVQEGYLNLSILDSTDPQTILSFATRLDPNLTLFIVATKSGGTVETLSFFKYFYNWVVDTVGPEGAGQHFIAITDPGSKLEHLAKEHDFRTTFGNDPNIGGRFSALSYFGLVPAALSGIDLDKLLTSAEVYQKLCSPTVSVFDNPGSQLGVILAEIAKSGRDKLTFLLSSSISSFGDWIEQLIAESTGKDGKGIVPIVGEQLGAPHEYWNDRLFIDIQLAGETLHGETIAALKEAGHPFVHMQLNDIFDIGGQFFLWEMATSIAGYGLGIHPFNQPNVEAAKILANQMTSDYIEKGILPDGDSSILGEDTLLSFLQQHQEGDYVAIQSYTFPNKSTSSALQKFRSAIRKKYKLATTIGYGPRFLHSTGQLHKGDRGNGLFIQLVSKAAMDAPIPDVAGDSSSSISFGILKQAQALGDAKALLNAGRRVITFEVDSDPIEELNILTKSIS
ncbi:MAG: glucose-6-phosphate isomerase [Chloroflexi bacterium]|nr:glucose-6-phosphate isomerase [Chloroflexota bacterium]